MQPRSTTSPEDPIAEAYPLMMKAAETLCCGRNAPDGGCYPYHRAWPFNRLIGQQGSVWRHGATYLASFRALARSGNVRRILISGSADYSLLAHVWHAFRIEGVLPEITILDFCEAPLAINRWYAKRVGATIATVACDILQYAGESAYDLVTTDNFLSQFPPADRQELVRRWWQLVRPGGYTVGAQSVRNSDGSSRRTRTPERIAERRDKLLQQVQGRDPAGYLAPEELGPLIEAYYKSRVTYPIRDADALRQLLDSNGFRMERTEMLSSENLERLRRDHTESSTGDRVHFVAQRLDELPPA